jgi:hypothetical protein
LVYTIYYLTHFARPGKRTEDQLGWWGWFDQSQYIASARNLLAGHLTPADHWYPLGYSVLAAPFVHFWPVHGFFLLDLVCLLGAYSGFLSFARSVGIGPLAASPIFLVTAFADAIVGETWVEPWTTTPSSALIWGLLACAAGLLSTQKPWRSWHLIALGLLGGALPLVRPMDAVVTSIIVLFVLLWAMRLRMLRLRHLAWIITGAAAVVLPYSGLHVSIYGFEASPYMLASEQVGFVFSRLLWKTYLLLIEPQPWYPHGQGLLARFPWLVLSLAELVLIAVSCLWCRGRAALTLLSLVIVVYWGAYFAYVDLMPSDIWRFHLVHYLKWSLPGLGLLAWIFVLRFLRSPSWYHVLAIAVIIGVLSLRVMPAPALGQNAEMIQFEGPPQTLESAFLREWGFSDALGSMGPLGARALPDSGGVRVLAQRREITGLLTWTNGPPNVQPAAAARWSRSITLGYPCWLPPYPCRLLPPRP